MAHDDRCSDKASRGHEVPIIRAVFVHGRKVVEGGGKRVGYRRQVDQEKVAAGRLAVGTPGFAELGVKVGEELGVDSD